MVDHDFYMNLCLKEAWRYQGLTYPNPAVGSLILDKNDKIIAIKAHQRAGTAHAELNVISEAFKLMGDTDITKIDSPTKKHQYILENHNNRFLNFTIYVTLEPCNHTGKTPPCSTLIKALGFKKVVIGSLDPNPKASGSAVSLKAQGIKVITGVLEQKCQELLIPFKKWQENDSFIFFKIAKTENGVYTGGVISSYESRKFVHKLREKIDLLVIGGNTVRVDRPTLDCRLCSSTKAPDVLIYSRRDDFDREIPLFDIKNRQVFIQNHFEILKNYRFIMIEGGEHMLKETLQITDQYLFFTAPDFKIGKTLQIKLKLKSLYKDKIGLDTIQWFRKI